MSNDAMKDRPKGGWDRLKYEITPNKEMIPVKLVIFLFVAGIGSFLPYLTLHMKEVGLTMQEIATMYAFIPIASVIGPLISGMVADKLANYTTTLALNIILCGVFHTLLLVVPLNQENIDLNQMKSYGSHISFSCDQRGYNVFNNITGSDKLETMRSYGLSSIKNCISTCEEASNETQICAFAGDSSNALSCFKHDFAENLNFKALTSQLDSNDGSFNITCSNPCLLKCQIKDNSGENYNPYQESIASSYSTFYVYFLIRALGALTLCASFSMLDSVVLAKVQCGKGGFGKQRVMTMLGQAFAPLVSGTLVDRLSAGKATIDYSWVFYFGDVLLLMAAIIAYKLRLQVDNPSQNMFKDFLQIIKNAEINIFLVSVTLLGVNWGFLETYLFVYLMEIGAPIYLLGITLTVGMCSGLPLLFLSDLIIDKFGRHLIFLLSFVGYAVRLIGYSQITNPWMCLPFEVLEVITYQIMWVAAATYCLDLAPKGLLATLTCIAGGFHYSLGRGIGSFMGGNLMLLYGSVKTLRIFGYLTIAGGIFYLVTYYGYVRNVAGKRKGLVSAKIEEGNKIEEL